MISGNTMVDIITPMHRKSIDDYIPKPFKIFDLKKAVKQAFCTHCKSVLATI